mgnify:CR=1 FL=1
MAGEIEKQYTIEYTENFKGSLQTNIDEWETSLLISDDKIKKFIRAIYTSIHLLKFFPDIHEDISLIYQFTEPTYRIQIGRNFAIFYRIDEECKTVQIGNLFKQKQMKMLF